MHNESQHLVLLAYLEYKSAKFTVEGYVPVVGADRSSPLRAMPDVNVSGRDALVSGLFGKSPSAVTAETGSPSTERQMELR
jgi:hypothetical protein